jgi:hypothetical protein
VIATAVEVELAQETVRVPLASTDGGSVPEPPVVAPQPDRVAGSVKRFPCPVHVKVGFLAAHAGRRRRPLLQDSLVPGGDHQCPSSEDANRRADDTTRSTRRGMPRFAAISDALLPISHKVVMASNLGESQVRTPDEIFGTHKVRS